MPYISSGKEVFLICYMPLYVNKNKPENKQRDSNGQGREMITELHGKVTMVALGEENLAGTEQRLFGAADC